MTLAAFCERFGIQYDLIEKQPDWNTSGYSLGMWSNGRRILERLDPDAAFDQKSEHIKHFCVKDGGGHVLRCHDLTGFYAKYGIAFSF